MQDTDQAQRAKRPSVDLYSTPTARRHSVHVALPFLSLPGLLGTRTQMDIGRRGDAVEDRQRQRRRSIGGHRGRHQG